MKIKAALSSFVLGITFGILNISPDIIIRVSKNLRVFKFISKIYGQKIVIMDTY